MTAATTVDRKNTLPVRNPRTGQVDYHITPPSAQEIKDTAARLRENQKAWAAAPLAHRLTVLRTFADVVDKNRDAIARAEALDTGRWRIAKESPDALIWGIRGWADNAAAILERAHLEGTSSIMPNVRYRTQLKPYPLLGVISPWNFPLMLSTIDAIPALIAGCAVMIKPSEVTPRFVEPMMDCIRQVPELAGVLTYVVGDGETGQNLIDEVDIVCFTGSVPTGRKVAEACARRFIPVFLELGGKDPVIVTENADVEKAATSVLRGSVFATGQICFSLERVYVQEKIYDRFVDTLVKKAEEIELNYPDMHQGHIGPFIFHKQAAVVDEQLDEAVKRGAKIRTGGKSQNLGGGDGRHPRHEAHHRRDLRPGDAGDEVQDRGRGGEARQRHHLRTVRRGHRRQRRGGPAHRRTDRRRRHQPPGCHPHRRDPARRREDVFQLLRHGRLAHGAGVDPALPAQEGDHDPDRHADVDEGPSRTAGGVSGFR
jgi:acyl-CoA reductase-like NAD-dependent aldehyde dehydrogenase